MEYRAAVLRYGALRGEPGHLPDDRETQHILGDTQFNEPAGSDVTAGQTRARPDQVSHRAQSN